MAADHSVQKQYEMLPRTSLQARRKVISEKESTLDRVTLHVIKESWKCRLKELPMLENSSNIKATIIRNYLQQHQQKTQESVDETVGEYILDTIDAIERDEEQSPEEYLEVLIQVVQGFLPTADPTSIEKLLYELEHSDDLDFQQQDSSEPDLDVVEQFHQLFPQYSVEFLSYVYKIQCLYDQEHAFNQLLDPQITANALEQFHEYQKTSPADEGNDQHVKQTVLERYSTSQAPDLSGENFTEKDKRKLIKRYEKFKQEQAQAGLVRYYDSNVVTRKGEKYVEIKPKEVWDGGSRGKVKTKGKRGKGWI